MQKFANFQVYPQNVFKLRMIPTLKMTLNPIFVLIIITHAQVFETIKKHGGQGYLAAPYHNMGSMFTCHSRHGSLLLRPHHLRAGRPALLVLPRPRGHAVRCQCDGWVQRHIYISAYLLRNMSHFGQAGRASVGEERSSSTHHIRIISILCLWRIYGFAMM